MNSPSERRRPLAVLTFHVVHRYLWSLLAWALSLAAAAVWIQSPAMRNWLWETTGEADLVEGLKGTVALALLQSEGQPLQLEPERPIDHLGMAPFGVNTFFQLEADPDTVRRAMAMLRDAHITWARQQFPWEDIEIHGRGDFEDRRNRPYRSAWTKYDRIVQEAANHRIRLLVRLDDPPDWAFAVPQAAGEKGPPDDYADYAAFVSAVAERYCDKVRYYQLWNEPNIFPEWGNRDVDPAGYAKLLQASAKALREACPGAVVVSAALAQTTEPGGKNMDDLKYLDALYEAGWQNDFDVLAVQAFGLWTGPTDRRVSPDRANFARPQLARDIMVRRGDPDKAVWITEMGWDSPPLFIPAPDAPPTATQTAGTPMPAPYGRVSEEERGRYTARAYQRILEEWPWAGVGFTWFLRRPNREWHTRPEGYFRLVEPEWQPLPAFDAMADAAGAVPALYRGRHHPDDEALRYAGPWRNAPLEGTVEQRVLARDAEVAFDFVGNGLTLRFAPPRALLALSEEERFRVTLTPTPSITPRPTFTPVPTGATQGTPENAQTATAVAAASESGTGEGTGDDASGATPDIDTEAIPITGTDPFSAPSAEPSTDALIDADGITEPVSAEQPPIPEGPTPDQVATVMAMATGSAGVAAATPAAPDRTETAAGPTRRAPYPGPGGRSGGITGMPPSSPLTPTLYTVLDGERVDIPLQTRAGVVVLERQGLPSGRHSLILRVDDGEAWLDEVHIAAADPPSLWYGLLRLVGGLVLAVVTFVVAANVLNHVTKDFRRHFTRRPVE